jgi:HlyD family secretion protein
VEIVPGMPVDAFLKTADRTPLSYLLKPFTDYFRFAFRET